MVRWGDTRPASLRLPGHRMAPFTSRELSVLHRALRDPGGGGLDVTGKALLAQIDDELRRRRIDPYSDVAP
jgi:hypothetical protein